MTMLFVPVVPDAGTGGLNAQRYGNTGEVYRCPQHASGDCSMCGGTGYRSVCNRTECHEHGCSFGYCGSTKAQFDAQEASRRRAQHGEYADHSVAANKIVEVPR